MIFFKGWYMKNFKFENLENEFSKLKDLPKEKIEEKNEDIKNNIRYFLDLTNSIEEKRIQVQNFSYQYLAILITAIGLLFTFKNNIPFNIYLFFNIILINESIFNIIIIIWYIIQSNYRYPFIEINEYSNQWKWFYYGNPYIKKIIDRPFFLNQKEKESSKNYYIIGLYYFTKNYIEENIISEIRSNLIQLYLVQVHNYYKNRFYLQLTKIRMVGFWFVIAESLIYWLHILIKSV